MLESYIWMHTKWWHFEVLCLAPLGILGSVILFFESPLLIGKLFSIAVGVICFYAARYALRKADIIKTPEPREPSTAVTMKPVTIRDHLRMKRTITEALEQLGNNVLDNNPRNCQFADKTHQALIQIERFVSGRFHGYVCLCYATHQGEENSHPTCIRRAYLILTKSRIPIQIRHNEAIMPGGDAEESIWLEEDDWSTPQTVSNDITDAVVASPEELRDLYTALSTMTNEVAN